MGASASAKSEPLVSLPVTLASVNAAGVVPRSYAPPGYAEKHEADYNTTIGYLENGNQRCVYGACACAGHSHGHGHECRVSSLESRWPEL